MTKRVTEMMVPTKAQAMRENQIKGWINVVDDPASWAVREVAGMAQLLICY